MWAGPFKGNRGALSLVAGKAMSPHSSNPVRRTMVCPEQNFRVTISSAAGTCFFS